jgi:hypothetical protein
MWNAIPFEKFMGFKERATVLMGLERLIGAVAFQQGLVTSVSDCSLCGDIFKFPGAFYNWYLTQDFNELQQYPYKGPVIKIWKSRTSAILLDA